jgi:hypothetical protein
MNRLLGPLNRMRKRMGMFDELVLRVDDLQKAVGRIERQLVQVGQRDRRCLQEYEFKVFSQWGEDGIIQHLIHAVEIRNHTFIEFGVQDYRESNTRFLLQNDNWSGLVMDASKDDIARVKSDPLYFRHNLRAEHAFITRENINELIMRFGFSGDIGLLSIDIDGNDYWVWEAITCVSPRIVICEYDSLLGNEHAVATPYDPSFIRIKAHYSFLYGGASIVALRKLGIRKGYSLVGSNSAGNNLFFVRNDVLGSLRVCSSDEAYVKAQFRNSRDPDGVLTFLGFDESRALIADMPLQDIDSNTTIRVRDIL